MRYRHRSGRAIAYILLGLLGGILGGLLVQWMGSRSTDTGLAGMARPYTEAQPGKDFPPAADGTVVRAVQVVGPAVVNIDTVSGPPSSAGAAGPDGPRRLFPFGAPEEPVPRRGQGSGVIVNAREGYVLTNNHVVTNARNITVTLPDKRSFSASVVGTDPYGDIALLKVNSTDLPEAKLGNSERLPIGSTAIAIGNPFGFENSVTVGVVSALARELPAPTGVVLEDLIQTDASINPGNSGGPLCDISGSVIGMNTAIIPFGQGIGFAVAVDTIKRSIDDIVKYGRARRPWLGVAFQPVTREMAQQLGAGEASGVLVRSVVPGSPAARAGIRGGDLITAVQQRPITEDEVLRHAIRAAGVGQTLQLTGFRGGRTVEFQVKLGEMPPPEELTRR